MPGRSALIQVCFKRGCLLRWVMVFLLVYVPLNFLLLRTEVEELSRPVPWGSNYREEEGGQLRPDPWRLQQEIRESQPQRQTFLENARMAILRMLGIRYELSQDEIEEIKSLWPNPKSSDDRILQQINWRPPGFTPEGVDLQKPKIIYDKDGMVSSKLHGRRKFQIADCPVDTCYLTSQGETNATMRHDAVIFRSAPHKGFVKQPGQVWVWFSLESPFHMGIPQSIRSQVNWTATYRSDSTLVAPYERFVPHANFTQLPATPPGNRNYAKGKSGKVAWFVSNCKDQNGRLAYARELQKYIQVDIFGGCGKLKCSRKNSSQCFEQLNKHYKFYLSFENSNCKDYITEKLYWNALYNDVVPVVMGAMPEDYLRAAPPGSYISVDDFRSPRHLADYLHKLDANDDLYNQYFRWKGTGRFIDTKFWCRLCSLLHAADYIGHSHVYRNLMDWWGGLKDGRRACLRKPKKGTVSYSSWTANNTDHLVQLQTNISKTDGDS